MQSRVFPILCHSTSCSLLCLFKRCSFFSDDDVSRINMMDRWRVVSWIFLVVVSPSRSVPRISRKLIRTNERRNWISRRKLMERSVDHLYGFHRISSEKYRRRVSLALGNLSISIGFAERTASTAGISKPASYGVPCFVARMTHAEIYARGIRVREIFANRASSSLQSCMFHRGKMEKFKTLFHDSLYSRIEHRHLFKLACFVERKF